MQDPVAEERLRQVEHALRMAAQATTDEARQACQQVAAAWLQLARTRLENPFDFQGGPFMSASGDGAQGMR